MTDNKDGPCQRCLHWNRLFFVKMVPEGPGHYCQRCLREMEKEMWQTYKEVTRALYVEVEQREG